MLPPALARLPVAAELILILVLTFGPLVYERRHFGRIHPVFAWGMAVLITSIPVTILVSQSMAWERVADWLIG